jgi:CubicO group peptidase (beta-lactamase class C family)
MSYKITINCLKFSPALLFMLFFQSGFAQVKKKEAKEVGTTQFQQLDDLVKQNQKLLGDNVVVMVMTDTLVYKTQLGEFDPKTVAPIASSSKWLTAALVMKMVELGKISLDDKIGQYIPVYDLYGKSYITIRDCLSHLTGIEAETGLKALMSKKNFKSLEEEVESFAKKEIQANPGNEFRYNGMGLNIAGRVLEIVSKKKFDMLIKQQLFTPLQMRKTTFSTTDGSALNPSGGAQSTAEEYMHFLQMLLNNGKYNGVQFLSEESVNELRKIHAKTASIKYAPKAGEGFQYALGSWVIEEGKDGKASALASPGLFGTWPVVDWCRGYASIIFVKTLMKGETKRDLYMQMKGAIDERLPVKCK